MVTNQLSGTLFIMAAPSGAGKTSLVNALIKKIPSLRVSISYTTRPPRAAEKEGENYFFVNPEQFAMMEAQKLFVEHAAVFGHAYGTSKEWVDSQLEAGQDVILEIDWQGAQQIKNIYSDVVSIFILPPSREALEQRLLNRGQDKAEVIQARLSMAVREMEYCYDFDYLVINDNFDKAVNDLEVIVRSRHLKTDLQKIKYQDLLDNLLSI